MKLPNIIEGLQTLLPYYSNKDGFHSGAEHDVFYAYKTDQPLSDNAISKMISLGWHQEYVGLDYCKDFSNEDYKQDESWVCYI